jgi:uncharacterized protein YggT (Ycf19 family)
MPPELNIAPLYLIEFVIIAIIIGFIYLLYSAVRDFFESKKQKKIRKHAFTIYNFLNENPKSEATDVENLAIPMQIPPYTFEGHTIFPLVGLGDISPIVKTAILNCLLNEICCLRIIEGEDVKLAQHSLLYTHFEFTPLYEV